jgi:hypothetical protein
MSSTASPAKPNNTRLLLDGASVDAVAVPAFSAAGGAVTACGGWFDVVSAPDGLL